MLLAPLCRLLGHRPLSRRILRCQDGSIIMVVKCARCGYVRSTIIPPQFVKRIQEIFG